MKFVINKSKIQIIITALIACFLLISLFLSSRGSSFITIVSICILLLFVFSTLEYNIYQLFMLLPFYMHLLIRGSQLFNFVLFVFLGKYFLANLRNINLKIFILPIILASFEIPRAIIGSGALVESIKWLITSFVFSVLLVDSSFKLDVRRIVNHFVLGLTCIAVSALWFNYDIVFEVSSRNHFEGIASIEKNTYAVYCCISLMSILYLFKCNFKKNKHLLISFILIFISAILMISKSFLIVFVACALMFLFASHSFKFFLIFLFGASITVMVILNSEFLSNVVNVYLGRFLENDNINELTTGRVEIFQEYIDYLLTHPMSLFFGEGMFTYMVNVRSNFVIPLRPHNVELELLISWGLIGTVIIGAFVFNCVKKNLIKLKSKKSFFALIPLFGFFLGLQSITLIYQNITFIIITYCIYLIIYNKHGRNIYYEK